MVKGIYIGICCWLFNACTVVLAQNMVDERASKQQRVSCSDSAVQCAKTMTVARHPNGSIWRLWANNNRLYYAISHDNGLNFNPAILINAVDEPIKSRGENRPKLAFSPQGDIYVSWASAGSKKYTGDIRFSFSRNNAKQFSSPVTVNNDGLLTGHSYNEMLVTAQGQLVLVWLDGRDKYRAKLAGNPVHGSSIYMAKARFSANEQVEFSNKKIATNTCVCCRLTLTQSGADQISVMYRNIFGDNIRDFSLVNVNLVTDAIINQPRVTFDQWRINGCPHQGAGLSASQQRLHLIWFNQGDKGKGVFYAHTDDLGRSLSTPLSVGQERPIHPNVMSYQQQVDIVWLEFNGSEHELWHQQSQDGGISFTNARQLTSAAQGADRPFLYLGDKGESYVSWQKLKQAHWRAKL